MSGKQSSSVSVVTKLRAEILTRVVYFLARATDVSLSPNETGCGAYPISYLTGTGGSFPEGKAAGALSL